MRSDAEEALYAAEREFHRLEAILTRFRPESELSRLNEARSLEVARTSWRSSGSHSRRAGGPKGASTRPSTTPSSALGTTAHSRNFPRRARLSSSGGPAAARSAIDGSRIELGPDVRLDLGGIGKGYAAERAAELLSAAGPALVNAGGDIAVHGGSWPVGVETSEGELTLELTGGGLATSGRDRRRWRRNGEDSTT